MEFLVNLSTFLVLFGTLFSLGQSGRILVVMPFASTSHKNTLVPLMTALADRGHQLTFITGKPTEQLRDNSNITEIVVDMKIEFSIDQPNLLGAKTFFQSVVDDPLWTKLKFMETFKHIPETTINSTLSDPQVQRMLHGEERFDLVLISLVTEYVGTPFAWHFGCPFIFFSPNVIFSDLPFVLGDWEHPQYVPFMVTSFTDRMNWMERIVNTFLVHFMSQAPKRYYVPQLDQLVRHYLPGYPSMEQVERSVSMVFTNTHPSFSYPRANPPNVIEIGALHCRPAQTLPKNLADFVESSGENGFFVFSVGSIIQMNEMPERILDIFKRAFSRIPQKVIWQWRNPDKDLKMPSNVLVSNWLPQQDVLGHPGCKGFLTHGGLLSTQEAVYHGVPVIGLPFVSDQHHNMMKAVRDGYGIVLSWSNIDEEQLFSALIDIAYQPKYQSAAKRKQSLLRDQPQSPLDRAVFWTEYVIRHKGAPALELGSRNLNRFQRSLLDVYLVLALFSIVLLAFVIMIVRVIGFQLYSNLTKKEV